MTKSQSQSGDAAGAAKRDTCCCVAEKSQDLRHPKRSRSRRDRRSLQKLSGAAPGINSGCCITQFRERPAARPRGSAARLASRSTRPLRNRSRRIHAPRGAAAQRPPQDGGTSAARRTPLRSANRKRVARGENASPPALATQAGNMCGLVRGVRLIAKPAFFCPPSAGLLPRAARSPASLRGKKLACPSLSLGKKNCGESATVTSA